MKITDRKDLCIRKYLDSIFGIWRRRVRRFTPSRGGFLAKKYAFPGKSARLPGNPSKIHREKPVNQGDLHYSANGSPCIVVDRDGCCCYHATGWKIQIGVYYLYYMNNLFILYLCMQVLCSSRQPASLLRWTKPAGGEDGRLCSQAG